MNFPVYPVIFLCFTSTLLAQSNRRSPGSARPEPQAAAIPQYYAREAPAGSPACADLKLAAAYCLTHTLSKNHHENLCWRRVKEALVQAGAVSAYPKTQYAYQAGNELVERFGFKKINIDNPYDAPVGAILVYKDNGELDGAGHVEFRTLHGFVSDYASRGYCKYRLTGVYIK